MASDVPAYRRPFPGTGVSTTSPPAVNYAVPISAPLNDGRAVTPVIGGSGVGAAAGANGAHADVPIEPPVRPLTVAETVTVRGLGAGLSAVDLAALLFSFTLLSFELSHAPTTVERLVPGLIAAAAAVAAMRSAGLYRSRCCARASSHFWRLCVASMCGGAALLLAEMQVDPQWRVVAVCTAAAVLTSGAGRWLYGRFLRARRSSGKYLRSVLLVGANADAADLRTLLQSEPELGYSVAGVVSGGEIHRSLADLPSARSLNDIPRLASMTGANGIFVVPYALSSRAVQAAIAVATGAGLHVQVWPGLRGIADTRLRPVPLSGEPVFYVEPCASARWQRVVKRMVDVTGATLALACAAPALAVAALLIKWGDGGPVFYRGERIGLHGKPIYPLKLRTMVTESKHPETALHLINERTDGPLFKSSSDPRVTRVGHFLRSSSIDELPQLLNVLRGTMSLVGPRPALPSEVAEFDVDFLRRHSVRPGMTGLWQVEARHNPSFHAYRRLDLRYVDNWSLRLDFWVIVATVPAVLSQARHALKRTAIREPAPAQPETIGRSSSQLRPDAPPNGRVRAG